MRRGLAALTAVALLALSLELLSPRFGAGVASAAPSPGPLRSEPGSFLGVLDSLHASILTIIAVPDVPRAPGSKRKRLIGTGVAANERDIVTTASLAFPDGRVRVLLGGAERSATLRGVDRQSNLAVFRIEEPLFHSLRRAAPQSLAVGTWVAVVSNVSVTRPQAALGQVVGRGERVDFPYSGDVLEIDAPTYPGLAGGAVINEDGEWVALIVGRGLSGPPSRGSRVRVPPGPAGTASSVLLAVPVDQVDRIIDDLIEHGTVRRGFLGIRLKRGPVAAGDTLGVRVDAVIPGSPAADAGIRPGDRVLAIEGHDLRTPDELMLRVAEMRPGDEAQITLLRDTEILPIRVVIGANLHGPKAPRGDAAPENEPPPDPDDEP